MSPVYTRKKTALAVSPITSLIQAHNIHTGTSDHIPNKVTIDCYINKVLHTEAKYPLTDIPIRR